MARKKNKSEKPTEIDSKINNDIAIVEITGDGNCLFRALSHQLTASQSSHSEIRKKVVEQMLKNPDIYQPFLEEPLSKHAGRMKKTGVYGGNLELASFCNEYRLSVCIHQANCRPYIINPKDSNGVNLLHIAYHPEMEHYSSVDTSSLNNIAQDLSKSMNENLEKLEKDIISSTKFKDVDKIRNLLWKFNGDCNRVIEELYKTKIHDISEIENIDDDSRLTEDEQENTSVQQDLDSSQITIPKTNPKLSSREKKKQKKKMQKDRALEKKRNKGVEKHVDTFRQDGDEQISCVNAITISLNAVHI